MMGQVVTEARSHVREIGDRCGLSKRKKFCMTQIHQIINANTSQQYSKEEKTFLLSTIQKGTSHLWLLGIRKLTFPPKLTPRTRINTKKNIKARSPHHLPEVGRKQRDNLFAHFCIKHVQVPSCIVPIRKSICETIDQRYLSGTGWHQPWHLAVQNKTGLFCDLGHY